jgi:hypothetical protein
MWRGVWRVYTGFRSPRHVRLQAVHVRPGRDGRQADRDDIMQQFDILFWDEDIIKIGGHGKSQNNNKKEYMVLNDSRDYFRKIVIRYNIFYYDPIKTH